MEFCKKLTEREREADHIPSGYEYRLPTEAEWEYAARGGDKSQGYQYAGSNSAGDVAWYRGNANGKTHEVGKKKSNELGLYDMSGNVCEFCLDSYSMKLYFARLRENPVNNAASSSRVIRGGDWYSLSKNVRPTTRDSFRLEYTCANVGFRVVLAPKISKDATE